MTQRSTPRKTFTPDETEAYVRLRSVECGDCLRWNSSTSSNGGLPVMYFNGKSNQFVRRVLWTALHGELPAGHVVTTSCGDKLCVAPDHLEATTKKVSARRAGKRGAYSNPAKIRKGVQTKLEKSWINDEVVAQVRTARTSKEAAEVTGVSLSYAKAIRSGLYRTWKSNPFSGLGARS